MLWGRLPPTKALPHSKSDKLVIGTIKKRNIKE